MTTFGALYRVLLRSDARDTTSVISLLTAPILVLIALRLALPESNAIIADANATVSSTIAASVATTGLIAGVLHIHYWRQNGALRLLRTFPISSGGLLTAQALVCSVLGIAQVAVLLVLAALPLRALELSVFVPSVLVPVVLGLFIFFFAGAIIGLVTRTLVTSALAVMGFSAILIYLGLNASAGTLPGWAQTIAPYSPVLQLRDLLSESLAGHWNPQVLGWGTLTLAVTALVLFLIGHRTLRWE